MKFHAVHRVGRPRGKTRGGRHGNKPDNPQHIIARFISRKDRDLVWSHRNEIKKTEHFSEALGTSMCKGCVQAEG